MPGAAIIDFMARLRSRKARPPAPFSSLPHPELDGKLENQFILAAVGPALFERSSHLSKSHGKDLAQIFTRGDRIKAGESKAIPYLCVFHCLNVVLHCQFLDRESQVF
jgi:hypothetical protein